MSNVQATAIVSAIGIVVEVGGALMLVALFSLLRRFVLRRAYFGAWTGAWTAVLVGLLALVVRYQIVPGMVGTRIGEAQPVTRAIYVVYQSSKLLAFVWFIVGTRLYIVGGRPRSNTRYEWIFAPALALVTLLLSPRGLNQMVMWQAPFATAASAYCAYGLLRLPASRRTLGTMASGSGFAMLGALWICYAVSFPLVIGGGPAPVFAAFVVHFNTYLDLLLNLYLGYGMVLMLMEDAKREVDDARAELRVAHDKLRRAALYDSLTESLNRRAFAEGVGLEMARATFGTVVMADVDDLKNINDRYGHATGDKVLRHFVECVRAALRPYDKLYRWGGDEFLMIVPSARAVDVQRRIVETLAEAPAVEANGSTLALRVSVGTADYASAEELEQAIERADQAMYSDKSGRKRRNSNPVGVVLPAGAGLPTYRTPVDK